MHCMGTARALHLYTARTLTHALTHALSAAGALALGTGFGAPPEPPLEPQTGGPLGPWAFLADKIIGA